MTEEIAFTVPTITSSAVTEEDVADRWEGNFDDLTPLQKVALAEGQTPGDRPLTQQEREANGADTENGEPALSPLQRIAEQEGQAARRGRPSKADGEEASKDAKTK